MSQTVPSYGTRSQAVRLIATTSNKLAAHCSVNSRRMLIACLSGARRRPRSPAQRRLAHCSLGDRYFAASASVPWPFCDLYRVQHFTQRPAPARLLHPLCLEQELLEESPQFERRSCSPVRHRWNGAIMHGIDHPRNDRRSIFPAAPVRPSALLVRRCQTVRGYLSREVARRCHRGQGGRDCRGKRCSRFLSPEGLGKVKQSIPAIVCAARP